MRDLSESWSQWVADLEHDRDQLRMELQLASPDARNFMHQIERELEDFRQRGHGLRGATPTNPNSVETEGKAIAAALRERFSSVRRLLEAGH